ncbi:NADH dehydrogenase [Paragonimus heterotremus]|uniref:NADH dehydrogenase n=1 Tax=Paragonimus heterotremus TaxID=100268 RepID=A0A8J4TEL0_9TREM|nr:NADH dehydrogenase [Paragonimus heterotremus]
MVYFFRLLSEHAVDWKCPDWREYNLDHPKLQKHVKALAAKGLKDPWIRNYAWQFSPKVYQTPWQFMKSTIFARLPHGLALAVLITAGVKGYGLLKHEQSTNSLVHE